VRENPYTVDAPLATNARGWNLDALRWLPQTGTRRNWNRSPKFYQIV